MKLETGQKLLEFGQEKQNEAKKRLCDISEEREQVHSKLFKISKSKRQKLAF